MERNTRITTSKTGGTSVTMMGGSEEIQLGDTGQYLKDGKLVDRNGDPIKKKEPCAGCQHGPGGCTCVPAFELDDIEEFHH